jgi:hypothetical protein
MENIYIVRWSNPEPSICLVKAESKAHVLRIMDQIADPSYCRVQKYDGPICISLDLKLKYHKQKIKINENITNFHTVVDDVSKCLDAINDVIPLEIAPSGFEEEMEMKEALIRFAFPHYSDYLEKQENLTTDIDEAEEVKCKKAIQQDFDDAEKDVNTNLYSEMYPGVHRPRTDLPADTKAS